MLPVGHNGLAVWDVAMDPAALKNSYRADLAARTQSMTAAGLTPPEICAMSAIEGAGHKTRHSDDR